MFAARLRRLAAIAVLGLGSIHASAQNYGITTFSVPGSSDVLLWDINNRDQVVGWAQFGTEEAGFTIQPFLLDARTLATTPFAGPSGSLGTYRMGISDAGVLVGSYTVSIERDPATGFLDRVDQAFIYDGTSFTTLQVPGATLAEARGISPDGRYVSGRFGNADTSTSGIFVYDRIEDAYVLTRPVSGVVNAANSSGILVGNDLVFDETTRPAFRYDIGSGTFSDYAAPDGEFISPRAISDDGVIAGWLLRGEATAGFVDHGDRIDYITVDGASSVVLAGINDARWVVGSATIDGVGTGIIAMPLAPPVPEPNTYALLALGLGVVFLKARRASPQ